MNFESYALRTVELLFLCIVELIQCSRLTVESSTALMFIFDYVNIMPEIFSFGAKITEKTD